MGSGDEPRFSRAVSSPLRPPAPPRALRRAPRDLGRFFGELSFARPIGSTRAHRSPRVQFHPRPSRPLSGYRAVGGEPSSTASAPSVLPFLDLIVGLRGLSNAQALEACRVVERTGERFGAPGPQLSVDNMQRRDTSVSAVGAGIGMVDRKASSTHELSFSAIEFRVDGGTVGAFVGLTVRTYETMSSPSLSYVRGPSSPANAPTVPPPSEPWARSSTARRSSCGTWRGGSIMPRPRAFPSLPRRPPTGLSCHALHGLPRRAPERRSDPGRAESSFAVPLNLTPDATGLKDWAFEDFEKTKDDVGSARTARRSTS